MTEAEHTPGGRIDRMTTSGGTVKWSEGGPFAVTPMWVLTSTISDRSKVLYAFLAARAGAESGTVRGHKEMEEWINCKRTALKESLRELEDLGAITVVETTTELGGTGRNEYVVHAVPPRRVDDGAPRRGGDQLPYRDPKELDTSGGKPPEAGGVAVAAVERPGVEIPFRTTRVNGRDLPFDALQHEAHIMKGSPRLREIPSALNGAGRNRTPGIRALAWAEAPPSARANPVAWEEWLAAEIQNRAAAYRAAMPGATLTPQALAKWWVDVRGGGETAAERALAIGRATLADMRAGE